MAHPWKHPTSGVWHLRQKTPKDLLARLRGTTITLPIGDEIPVNLKLGQIVCVSLRTKDERVARARHAMADAALQMLWQRARSPEAILAAEKIATAVAPASTPGPAGGMPWSEAVRRFGPGTGKLLTELGVPATDANQAQIISETASIMDAAYAMLRQKKFGETPPAASGTSDLSATPSQAASPSKQASRDAPITVASLWETYKAYHADKLAPDTLNRYGASVSRLGSYLSNRDVRDLTEDDIFAWAEHRRDNEGIHARTINRNDLVAISSLFTWAGKRQGGRVLKDNPARGVTLDAPRHVQIRERAFRDAEVEAILRAANDVVPLRKAEAPAAYARRWCPWLAAYSGARISELTALEVADIREEQGVHIMHFAYTKNLLPRSVPIHEHLIALGFLDYVASVGSGPLFLDLSRHAPSAKARPNQVRSRKVAEWVRETVSLDPDVDPNHGWRHTFKTRAVSYMKARFSDAITGHSPGSVPRKYEAPSIKQMAEALSNFPRYNI